MNYLEEQSNFSLTTLRYSESEVFNIKFPSISLIKRYYNEIGKDGNNNLKALLALLITDLNNFFNIGKSMTITQIEQTCELIINDYGNKLSIEEIKLIFQRAKKGYFGAIYDRLDGQMIFLWIEKFLSDRVALFEQKRESESNQYKSDLKNPLFSEIDENNENMVKLSDLWKSLIEELKMQKIEKIKEDDFVPKEKDPMKIFFNTQCNLFDRLVKYKNRKDYVKIGDRMLSKSEFVNYRFETKR